jgi:hypothetical protein
MLQEIAAITYLFTLFTQGQIAQSVEQRTENPCVAGSIPVLATLPEMFSEMIISPVFLCLSLAFQNNIVNSLFAKPVRLLFIVELPQNPAVSILDNS